jgi:hypothetical protein
MSDNKSDPPQDPPKEESQKSKLDPAAVVEAYLKQREPRKYPTDADVGKMAEDFFAIVRENPECASYEPEVIPPPPFVFPRRLKADIPITPPRYLPRHLVKCNPSDLAYGTNEK